PDDLEIAPRLLQVSGARALEEQAPLLNAHDSSPLRALPEGSRSPLTSRGGWPTMGNHAGPVRQVAPRGHGRPFPEGTGRISMRTGAWRAIAIGLVAVALTGAAAIGDAHAQKKGGVLKIGNLGEPPSLDPHWGTQTITEVLTNHIYEGLYSLDASYRPVPMLA